MVNLDGMRRPVVHNLNPYPTPRIVIEMEDKMLQVAHMMGVENSSPESPNVLRFSGPDRQYIFLLSEEFLDNLPLRAGDRHMMSREEFLRNWTRE